MHIMLKESDKRKLNMKKLLVVLAFVAASTSAFATPPGGIGFVNSLDLKCKGDSCVFYNKSGANCASGWSIAVFDSPQGRFIGWLAASSGYPGSESDKPLVYKRWRERSRNGFTYLRGIEGVGEKNSWSKLFMPRDNNNENLPVNQPTCG
jgi:hypothetical protein